MKVKVSTPILVNNAVFDGHGNTYYAAPSLGDGSQREGQRPIFILRGQSILRDVKIDRPAADGIHIEQLAQNQSCVISKVTFLDVGEDAITVKAFLGKVFIEDCKFYKAADKAIQINGEAITTITRCYFDHVARCVRVCGTCGDLKANVTLRDSSGRDIVSVLKATNKSAKLKIVNWKSIKNVAKIKDHVIS